MAPATIPIFIPKAVPMPTRAMPTVAEVVQLEPVATETIAHTITAATKKIVGFRIIKP